MIIFKKLSSANTHKNNELKQETVLYLAHIVIKLSLQIYFV